MAVRREEPLTPEKLKNGDKFYKENITLEILEVTKTADIMGTEVYIIAYRIRDGNFESPTAHIFARRGEDVRQHIERIMSEYLRLRSSLRTRLGRR